MGREAERQPSGPRTDPTSARHGRCRSPPAGGCADAIRFAQARSSSSPSLNTSAYTHAPSASSTLLARGEATTNGEECARCESAAVPGGEVHAAGIVEALPLELVRAARLQSIAKRDDRPLADRLEQRDRAPGRLIAPGHVDANAAALKLGHRRLALGVPAERAVEVDLRAELGQDRRGHRAAPARARERAVRVKDLPVHRQMRHRDEVDPLDVADHTDVRHACSVPRRGRGVADRL